MGKKGGGRGFGWQKGEESVIDRPPRGAPCRPLISQGVRGGNLQHADHLPCVLFGG